MDKIYAIFAGMADGREGKALKGKNQNLGCEACNYGIQLFEVEEIAMPWYLSRPILVNNDLKR
jgi:hypothetical protein